MSEAADTLTNVPRWFHETYDGMETDMADEIFKAIRIKTIAGLNNVSEKELKTAEVQARIEAEALMAAAQHMDALGDATQRAFLKMVWKIYHDQAHRIGKDEYESIEEFLVDRIPRLKEKSGELSDTMFLLEHFLPLLAQVGKDWSPDKMLRLREKWSKTRAAVPNMRNLVRQFNDKVDAVQQPIKEREKDLKRLKVTLQTEPPDSGSYKQAYAATEQIAAELPELQKKADKVMEEAGEEFQQGVEKIFDVISDTSIPTWGHGGVGEKLKETEPTTTQSFDGYRVLAPNKEVFFMIKVPERYAQLVETALRTIINFKISDPILFYNEIQAKFFPHGIPINVDEEAEV